MSTTILLALFTSSILYLFIGYSLSKKNTSLADLLPIVFGSTATVRTEDEFSKSTVASTVSLATIVLAYFELAGYFGLYLLWTAITTVLGIILVSLLARKIWAKMKAYNHRPSMHEFLAKEFNSPKVGMIASICTSIGFLMIFATELIVGSRFLASLIPTIPEWITVLFLCSVGFLYTLMGGFRAVIKTDQLQMWFIWGLILVLGLYTLYSISGTGWNETITKAPKGVLDFAWRDGLTVFLIGIAIMNIPTHLSNMAIWQRISAAQNPEIVVKGFRKSIWGMLISWSLLSLIACFAYTIVTPENSNSVLVDYLKIIGTSPVGMVIVFITVLGLYGAMLSTASTNLIVVTHTLSEDVLAKFKSASLFERIKSKEELRLSRILLIASALFAIFLVEGLKHIGFSIADLVFAIYGGALVLFPPILVALLNKRDRLSRMSFFVVAAVVLGFILAWGSAVYGRSVGNSNLVFLAPTIGVGVSSIMMILGLIVTKQEKYL